MRAVRFSFDCVRQGSAQLLFGRAVLHRLAYVLELLIFTSGLRGRHLQEPLF